MSLIPKILSKFQKNIRVVPFSFVNIGQTGDDFTGPQQKTVGLIFAKHYCKSTWASRASTEPSCVHEVILNLSYTYRRKFFILKWKFQNK